jgi:hypothetical protein
VFKRRRARARLSPFAWNSISLIAGHQPPARRSLVMMRMKWMPGALRRLAAWGLRSIAFALIEGVVLALLGCASDLVGTSRSGRGPADPTAPEAPLHAPEETMPSSPPAATPAPSSSSSPVSADAGVTYTCPMHPEVQSNSPGHCPKCGMTLVPKTP